MYTYQTSVYSTSVVFPWLTASSSSTDSRETAYSTTTFFSSSDSAADSDGNVYLNSLSQSGLTSGFDESFNSYNYQKYLSLDFPAESGETYTTKTIAQRSASTQAGQQQFGVPILGSNQNGGGLTISGITENYIATYSIVLGSDGYSYETLVDNFSSNSRRATFSGAFSYASGGVGTNSGLAGETVVYSSSEYKKRYEYQRGETQISNEYFSASTFITQNSFTSGKTETSFSNIAVTTEYPTVVSTSYFTSQTGTETSQTATTSETYEGRSRHEIPYTLTTDGLPYKTSTSTLSALYFLSHSYVISGTSSYVTITESSSTFSALTTSTTLNPARPMLSLSNTTSFYNPLGMEATAIKNVGNNWANGNVGGYLVKNGNNQNLIQDFSAFSIIVSDDTLLPALSMGVYTSSKPYNTSSDQFAFGRLNTITTSDQLTLLFYTTFANTQYGFEASAGSITSTTFEQGIYDTYSTEALLFTTGTMEEVCLPNSQTYEYIGTLGIDKTTSVLFVYGSNKNILTTYHSVIGSTITGNLVWVEPALDYLSSTIINAASTFVTNRSGGHTFERQSFNTATAKSFYHLGEVGAITIVGNGQGQYQVGNIYLHTSVSNKTDNTGYFMFSNNVSQDAVPVPLTYNANSVISNDNQLRDRKQSADTLYEYANFGGSIDGEGGGRRHYTPISQSSYSFQDFYDYSNATIGEHTVSFGGPQDSGSFTRKTRFTNSSNTEFGTTSGTISYLFAESAGTGLELEPLYNPTGEKPPLRGLGGVRNLYTAIETLYINTLGKQFAFTLRNSELTVGRPISYTFINYSTDTSTGSSSIASGSIAIASSIVQGLKYISVNGDSWVVIDNDLSDGTFLSAVELPHPSWASTTVDSGILAPFGYLTSYYGDTYWQY
jgi:hypothetical protein